MNMLAPAAWLMGSARASLRRAHDSRAVPNADAAFDSDASARRYCFAEATRSEYAVCESARLALERTACAGRGAGGSGRLNCEMGFAVDATE